jgi:hypothetical protein
MTTAAVWMPLGAAAAHAEVNLEWRPAGQAVDAGDTVRVGLYAVSDDDSDQSVAGIDAILDFSSAALRLEGRDDDGPYAWLASWFPDDSKLDDLNGDWLDGDALYQSVRRGSPEPPAYATPEGLLVTTIVFTAVGHDSRARVGLAESGAVYSTTKVLDGLEAGVTVTGTLGAATVTVRACGQAADADGDCDVDASDAATLVTCLGGPERVFSPCAIVDMDTDADVDLGDYAALQRTYTGRR